MTTGKNTAGRTKVILAFLLLFGPAILLIIIATRGCEHKFTVLEDYGEGKEYAFTDGLGRSFSSKDFDDKVVVIANLQQTCPDSCGISFWSFNQLIYQEVQENQTHLSHVKLITFATDLNGNPIEDLSQLQMMLEEQVQEYNPDIWYLAKGNAKELFDLEHNNVSLLEKGDEYTGGEAFQELILLMDKQNHLRMVLNGHTEGMVRKMKEHVALLQKEYDKEEAKGEN